MGPSFPVSRGVRALLIANLAAFVLQTFPVVGAWLQHYGAAVAHDIFARGEIWRLVSYMFLHSVSTVFHLLLNMMALWMFGTPLEERWGTRRFLLFYGFCGIGAALLGVFYLLGPVMRFVPVIGASGAVLGLLTAYAFYYPNREVLLFFVLPVRVWIIVAGYAILSLLFAFSQQGGMTAHLIHFGGIAAALAILKGEPLVVRQLRERRERLQELRMRVAAEETAKGKRFFEDTVDPILAKISREGMGSLTAAEKRVLRRAGESGKNRMKKEKIVPLDAFRDPD